MTTFHIVSDLHLDFAYQEPFQVLADALILAGDIATLSHLHLLGEVTSLYRKAGKPVFFVPGNHEYYGTFMPDALRAMHRWCQSNGITLLHNRVVFIGGARVFGATTWTDYEFERNGTSLLYRMSQVESALNDHRYIKVSRSAARTSRFLPKDALRAHQKTMRIMAARLGEPFQGPTVVITHHGVHGNSVSEQYKGSPINAGFVSDLSGVMGALKPALWVHGHVHNTARYRIGDTEVVCNPRGYPLSRYAPDNGKRKFENPAFDERMVVRV